MNEWRINLPSGQCPFAEYIYNFDRNLTEALCNIERAKGSSNTNCSEQNCPLKIREAQLFDGLFLTDVEGVE